MKTLIRLTKLSCAFAIVALLLTACWDYQRIDKRAMVLGIGIEAAGEKDYRITVQIPSMPAVISGQAGGSSGGGSDAGKSAIINITETGSTFAQALMQAQNHIDRNLFLGTLQTIVVSDRLPANRSRRILSELSRNQRIPKMASIVVTDDSPRALLQAKAIQDEPPALYINKSLTDTKKEGYRTATPFWTFIRDDYGAGVDPKTSIARLDPEQKIIIEDIAVFRGTRIVGTLRGELARGLNWALGNARNIPLEIEAEGGNYLIRSVSADARIKWRRETGRDRFDVRIRAYGELALDAAQGGKAVTQSEMERIESLAEKRIEDECLRTFSQLQIWRADPYGLGRQILIRNPRQFRLRKLDTRWEDELANSRMVVKASFRLTSKGEMM